MAAENVNLSGVPETMLWTLHNRASEAKRPGGILTDPEAVRIYDSIDYDFERSFGKPDGTHAWRSKIFDDAVRPWLEQHPSGTVVELGSGLETQFHRCDNGTVNWVCVDVPDAIAVRERFLPPGPRCRHIPRSALDTAWIDEIPPGDVFITAQGLFMYFEEEDVRRLIVAIADRLPGAELMFDTIPPWFSRHSVNKGFKKTAHYTAPPMPWGLKHDDAPKLLRGWSERIDVERRTLYGKPGPLAALVPVVERIPPVRNLAPMVVRARIAD